jgi:hypothetical protein
VIDELAADPDARRSFLQHCSLDGLLLALSHAGGLAGTRSLPLLVDDADWDAAAGRIHELVPDIDDAGLLRLLASLEAAIDRADARAAAELHALATTALGRLPGCWRSSSALPDPEVLGKWLDLAARLPEPAVSLDVERIWELVVPPAVTPYTAREAEEYVRWLRLAAALTQRSPDLVAQLGFPEAYTAQLDALVAISAHYDGVAASGTMRETTAEALGLLGQLVPRYRARATYVAEFLRWLGEETADEAPPELHVRSPDPPPPRTSIVRRILADLG